MDMGANNRNASPDTGLLKFDVAAVAVCAAIAGIIWVVLAPLRIWHTIGRDGQEHPVTATWIAYGISGAVIMAVLMFFSIRASAKDRRAPVRVPEAPRMAAMLEAGPPACAHPHAEPLVNRFALGPVGWYCAECDTGLPREHGDLRRFCCGSAPGGAHVYNCPQRLREMTS